VVPSRKIVSVVFSLIISSIILFFLSGVVFEDAPSGIRSGRTAGCKTIALLTTHSREQIEAAQPDFIVKDLSWSVIPRIHILPFG